MRNITLKDLLETGAHFGHQSRRWNPAMKPYIFDEREGVHIFDLAKTKEGLEQAVAFVKTAVSEGKVVLFVGTKRQAQAMVKQEAQRVGVPFVTERWIGGLLTNWKEISKRIGYMKELKERREQGELKKYTKREQILFDREIARLEKFFGGVASLEKPPDVLFVVDTKREEVAVREAQRVGISVVGMVDTNADVAMVEQVIPINDDAVKAIELVVGVMAEAVEEGKKKAAAGEAASEKAKGKGEEGEEKKAGKGKKAKKVEEKGKDEKSNVDKGEKNED